MNQELIDCVYAVNRINENLQEQLGIYTSNGEEFTDMDPWIWAEVQISNEGYCVMFLGECIHNSENDERKWKEAIMWGPAGYEKLIPAHHEPIEPYMRKRINELISKLSKIKL